MTVVRQFLWLFFIENFWTTCPKVKRKEEVFMKQDKNAFRQEKNEKRTTERLLAYATAMKQKQEAKNASK